MVFSSEIFIFGFLFLFLLVYYLVPRKVKNFSILFFSLFFFYAWDNPKYLVIMLFSILLNYFGGMWIGKLKQTKDIKKAKIVLFAVIFLNLFVLCFFKYTNLIVGNFNSLFSLNLPLLKWALPIGISFYTFQTMSYTIDVYRGDCGVQKNVIDFAAYVTMFPQLIAGPIVRYKTVELELRTRQENITDFSYGIKRFIIGLAKKSILANGVGLIWDEISVMNDRPVMTAWIGAIAFTFQIYFDFSGYSDMAIGMGKMFGFNFLENFNLPYIARSITDFWRRWHISLSTWFKEYVYIPLGGNRKGLKRQIINLLIVWGLTGLWHGASWNYLLWGLYFGIILILEKVFLLKILDKLPKFIQHIYSLILIVFGWVIFANEDFVAMKNYFVNMFYSKAGFGNSYSLYLVLSNAALFILCILFSTPLPRFVYNKVKCGLGSKPIVMEICSGVVCSVLFIITICYVVGGSYNPFLYFRF